jgi:trk system potassium uptake protein TrkH
MNYRLVFRILGLMLLLLSGTMLVCLGVAMGTGWEEGESQTAFLISIGATSTAAMILLLLGRRAGGEMLRKEGIALVGLSWIFCSLFGALPYMFSSPDLSPARAIFEATSGFTTTGATVIGDLDAFPSSILLWRALTQWLGGMGVLVLFVAILSYLGVGGKSLFQHESSAQLGHSVHSRVRDTAMQMWLVYLVLTVICGAGLVILGMEPFDAVTNAMTCLATGGFCVRDASIAHYDSLAIYLWIILFMILGGISFLYYVSLINRPVKHWKLDEELLWYLGFIVFFSAIITVELWLRSPHYGAPFESLVAALFQVVSLMTTTGYATHDYDTWPLLSKAILLSLMFVGGSAGSTAGGLKVMRLLVLFKVLKRELVQTYRPNQIFPLKINRHQIDVSLQRQTVFLIALAGFIAVIMTLLVSFTEGELRKDATELDMVSTFSAVIACQFNIGPGFGAVGPTHNFGDLSENSLMILSFAMILGRLEFFAVLVLFLPSLWRRY